MSAQSDTMPESGGKGSFPRTWNNPKFREHFDDIFRRKPPEAAPASKPKVCVCSQRLGTHPCCAQHPQTPRSEPLGAMDASGFGSLGEYLP